MRGIICYYSGTGNTRLACQYLAARVGMQFDFHDVITKGDIDLSPYDVVGFACPTDFWGVPELFGDFIARIPPCQDTPAFVLNTFGALSGHTLLALAEQVAARGFTVFGGHSVHMPEAYPPMIAMHLPAENQPTPRTMRAFGEFVAHLDEVLRAMDRGEETTEAQLRLGPLNSLMPTRPRTTAREDMGQKFVDSDRCNECGTCAKRCPYHAITLAPKPVFDDDTCRGCWRCYNQCPLHAIYTAKYRGGPYYPRPPQRTRKTLLG
jgi:ferredoxin/flavodoxin